jgi:hypothetical protein
MSLLDNLRHIIVIANNTFSVLAGILALYEIYAAYPLGVHGPPVQNAHLRVKVARNGATLTAVDCRARRASKYNHRHRGVTSHFEDTF